MVVCFGHLSTGVNPVINSLTRPSEHCTDGMKNLKTNEQTKGGREKTEKHGFRTVKCRQMKWALFNIICVYV